MELESDDVNALRQLYGLLHSIVGCDDFPKVNKYLDKKTIILLKKLLDNATRSLISNDTHRLLEVNNLDHQLVNLNMRNSSTIKSTDRTESCRFSSSSDLSKEVTEAIEEIDSHIPSQKKKMHHQVNGFTFNAKPPCTESDLGPTQLVITYVNGFRVSTMVNPVNYPHTNPVGNNFSFDPLTWNHTIQSQRPFMVKPNHHQSEYDDDEDEEEENDDNDNENIDKYNDEENGDDDDGNSSYGTAQSHHDEPECYSPRRRISGLRRIKNKLGLIFSHHHHHRDHHDHHHRRDHHRHRDESAWKVLRGLLPHGNATTTRKRVSHTAGVTGRAKPLAVVKGNRKVGGDGNARTLTIGMMRRVGRPKKPAFGKTKRKVGLWRGVGVKMAGNYGRKGKLYTPPKLKM